MTEPQWPQEKFRLAPTDYLAALGQVTFVYNMLESMMGNIFELCAPLGREFARRLFHELNNRQRVDLLTAFVEENEKDQEGGPNSLLCCISCYNTCTENRNILLHSIYFNPDPNLTSLLVNVSQITPDGKFITMCLKQIYD